jgi:hypothetical protein
MADTSNRQDWKKIAEQLSKGTDSTRIREIANELTKALEASIQRREISSLRIHWLLLSSKCALRPGIS